MNRRASLPGADELFRATSEQRVTPLRPEPPTAPAAPGPRVEAAGERVSARVRHETKITVYLSDQELLDLEQARLRLRAEFGIAVDRGRIVREAVGEMLRELHEDGPDAAIVRRLS